MRELIWSGSAGRSRRRSARILPLEVDELCYAVKGTRILEAVNLRLDAGGCTAIMGYNGAGKSVLLRLLHGLLEPTSGTIRWAADAQTAAHQRAMVFQTPVMLRRSVEANIRYALAQRRYPRALVAQRLRAIVEETNLVALRDRPAAVLSGGERQRVALARALAPEPELVFLDEPTASLDPAATIAIEDILMRAKIAGRKLVLVTQSIGQAERLADDVVFLHHGTVTEHTPTQEFLARPRSRAGAAFVEGRLLT